TGPGIVDALGTLDQQELELVAGAEHDGDRGLVHGGGTRLSRGRPSLERPLQDGESGNVDHLRLAVPASNPGSFRARMRDAIPVPEYAGRAGRAMSGWKSGAAGGVLGRTRAYRVARAGAGVRPAIRCGARRRARPNCSRRSRVS